MVGYTTIKAIYSPGHTIGSTSFLIEDHYLLTGDILFIDSIGRMELAGKAEDWIEDLRNTLYKCYKELSMKLIVLPAHYMGINEINEECSISERLGILYQKNHGLKIEDQAKFRNTVTENLPLQPKSFQEIHETKKGEIHQMINRKERWKLDQTVVL
jgi:glyoxylase-like metal-dependent hydrolase (beta-lactamase superfamily II)